MTAIARPRQMSDLDIAAELRRQNDELVAANVVARKHLELADQRNAHLARQVDEVNRQVEDLRAVLLGTAQDLAQDGRQEDRGEGFWFTAWSKEKQRNAEQTIQLAKQAKWLLEGGQEATRLQTALEAEREKLGRAASLLDATEARVVELEAHIERLSETIASREAS